MKPFLKLVAEDIYKKFGDHLQNICIVFPNRRPILYFNKYLSEIVPHPVWAAQCTTISAFVQSLTDLNKADDLFLLFELYKVYIQERKNSETFEEFYYWGELMLSDFDDIDKYMVDAKSLFQNLASLKDIKEHFDFLDENQVAAIQQFWKNFKKPQLSSHQKEFSNLWSTMNPIYAELRKILSEKKLAYEGMIYRHVADQIQTGSISEPSFNNIIFVGFNALNECEKIIFRHFHQSQKALFYWDYDIDYIQNEYFEAGYFIRKNLSEFPSPLEQNLFQNFQNPGNIELFAIPSQVGQAKIIGKLLKQNLTRDHDLENTAIVLPDENLLLPLLHSIPEEVEGLNIAMGYPVRNSLVISLFEAMVKLYSGMNKEKDDQNVQFYFKLVLKVLNHPLLIAEENESIKDFKKQIIIKNPVFIDASQLPKSELLKVIFSPCSEGFELINRFLFILKHIGKNLFSFQADKENHSFKLVESETFRVIYNSLNRFEDLLAKSTISINIQLCFRLLMKVLNNLTVPFEGEPLKGLQILGFLESRILDFENLFILSVNEGTLPKTQMPGSFIPYNLRKGFRMPTLEHRDAMFSYYFYRLIQRAKNIYLIYSTKADKMGSAEISRFATQLLFNNKFKINQKVQTFNIIPSKIPEIKIEKTNEILEKLENKYIDQSSESYLSPSALSNYIDCSLRFYFRYVGRLKEYVTVSGEIDASMLGNILHKSIYKIYYPFLNRTLEPKDYKNLLKNSNLVEKVVRDTIIEEYYQENLPSEKFHVEGQNLIILKVLKKYVHALLSFDSNNAPFKILNLEKNIISFFEFNFNSEKKKIRIGGNIDRIDQINDEIRIVDYKTGIIENNFTDMDELFKSFENKKTKKEIFQVILYSLIYKKSVSQSIPVTPVLYNLRKIFDEHFDPVISFKKSKIKDVYLISGLFNENLELLISEIFNPDIPFGQTTDLSKCKNCPYNIICHRQN